MTQANNLVSFKRPDGREVSGYLARPAKLEGAPAIVAGGEDTFPLRQSLVRPCRAVLRPWGA